MKKSVISLGAVALVSGAMVANTGDAEAATYTVKKGDTLSAIAVEHKTTVKAIKGENNLESDLLFTGQELNIDELKVEAKESPKTHTVKAGETVAKIAEEYEVTVADIVAWNDLKSADLILVGEVLNVSKPETNEMPVEENYEAPAEETYEAPVEENYEVPAEETYEAPEQYVTESYENNDVSYNETYEQPQKEQTQEQPAQEQQPVQETKVANNSGLDWSGLASCESGGDAGIVSANGMYHGLYQFDVDTWQSVGGSGLPSNASAAEQTKRAEMLYEQRGSSPWPVCGANL